MKDYLNKTIDQLEGRKITERPDFESYVVQRSYELFSKPIIDFEPEDLRLMIGQGFGLNYLVPLAIDILEEDLFIDATFYPGDLLHNILEVKKTYWQSNPKQKKRLMKLVNEDKILSYDDLTDDIKNQIIKAFLKLKLSEDTNQKCSF